MSSIMEKIGYKNEWEPTGIVVHCTGNGRHNGKVGAVYLMRDALYVKLGGIYVKRDNLIERGYTLTTYEWVIFKHNDEELCRISIEGLFAGEINATKELLAYENGVDISDIKVVLSA